MSGARPSTHTIRQGLPEEGHDRRAFERHRARGDVRHSQRNTRRFAFSGPAFAHADATREMHRALTGGKKHEMPEEIRDWISGRVRRELTDMAVGNAGRARLEVITRFVVGAFFEVMHWWLDEETKLSPAELNRMFEQLAFDGVNRALADSG